LLEYVVTETNVYLFVMTQGQAGRTGPRRGKMGVKAIEPAVVMTVYPLNIKGSELVGRIVHFQQLLATRNETFRQPARELYDLLMKPAEDQLASKTKLVIVPDGILWRVPFEALESGEDRYLIDQVSLSYAPSLSALRELTKPRERPAPVGLGRPFFRPDL